MTATPNKTKLCIGYLIAALLAFAPAAAHDGERHGISVGAAEKSDALPFDIGGPFTLTDHNGQRRSDKDFRGRYMLVFFGYANCRSICPVGLGRMMEALDALGESGSNIQPLLISVDPEFDTPANMRENLRKVHPRLLGLTGSAETLKAVAKAYQVESKQVSVDPEGRPVFAHGSYIYLMDPDGKLATIIPPILGDEQIAGIIRRYVQ